MTRRLHEPVPGQLSLLELLELLEMVDQVVAARVDDGHVDVDEACRAERVAGLGEWEQRVLAFAVEHHLSTGGLGVRPRDVVDGGQAARRLIGG